MGCKYFSGRDYPYAVPFVPDPQVGDAIVVTIAHVIREEIDQLDAIFKEVARRVITRNKPPATHVLLVGECIRNTNEKANNKNKWQNRQA